MADFNVPITGITIQIPSCQQLFLGQENTLFSGQFMIALLQVEVPLSTRDEGKEARSIKMSPHN